MPYGWQCIFIQYELSGLPRAPLTEKPASAARLRGLTVRVIQVIFFHFCVLFVQHGDGLFQLALGAAALAYQRMDGGGKVAVNRYPLSDKRIVGYGVLNWKTGKETTE